MYNSQGQIAALSDIYVQGTNRDRIVQVTFVRNQVLGGKFKNFRFQNPYFLTIFTPPSIRHAITTCGLWTK